MSWSVVLWFLVAGVLLSVMGTAGPVLKRVWLSCSIIYLVVGYIIGPAGIGLLSLDLVDNAKVLEHLTEVAVIVSLFGAGMKMRFPLRHHRWRVPLVLATASMVMTIAITAAIGYWAIGLTVGMAMLLAAVLAPTDPVLAAEVQLEDPDDTDHLRLGLTGEAGLNDGAAFPFVLLAVGLIDASLHPLGNGYGHYLVVDVVYKIAAGLVVGALLGWALAHAMLAIRKRVRADVGADEMLVLGFIFLIYGLGLAIDTYAFLAVFAAAVAMRRVELEDNDNQSAGEAIDEAQDSEAEHEADSPQHAAALLTRDGLIVADTLERLDQIALVVLLGVLLSTDWPSATAWWFGGAMVLLVRPIAVLSTLWVTRLNPMQLGLAAWFGVRGIGTFYYLTHALNLGVVDEYGDVVRRWVPLTLATVAVSIVLHGVSVTPLMRRIYRDEASE